MRGSNGDVHGSTVNPLLVGGTLAAAAAVAFGLTTPLVQLLGRRVGAFTTAGLLYAGAALASLFWSVRSSKEAPLRALHARRLVGVALLGAVVAPACLAWGLQRTQGTIASLMLNTEAVFTVILARVLYREHVGVRVGVAVVLMLLAGALLVAGPGHTSAASTWGTFAIAAASLAWAADNALTRPLADFNPTQVVLVKAGLGAALSLLIAIAASEPLPRPMLAVGIAACGAIGYGISLRLYLGAQRRMGAGRTGSVFALAPFVGAVGAWVLGDRGLEWSAWAAGILFALGVLLHLTERHGHGHRHEAVEHEHAHRHDDGHHDHRHDVAVEGEHSHSHRHAPGEHSHPHAPDLHHQHAHD